MVGEGQIDERRGQGGHLRAGAGRTEDQTQDDQAGADAVHEPDEQAELARLHVHPLQGKAHTQDHQGVAEPLDPLTRVEHEPAAPGQVSRVALRDQEVVVEHPVPKATDLRETVGVGDGQEERKREQERGNYDDRRARTKDHGACV